MMIEYCTGFFCAEGITSNTYNLTTFFDEFSVNLLDIDISRIL